MHALVTGAAGFIGSTLVDRLLSEGHDVRGVDCFTPYYARRDKEANLAQAREHARFAFVEADLRTCALPEVLDGIDVVFHQAAQAGVRLSWSDGFGEYLSCNVLVTQRLLEAARDTRVRRVVYASSSSVYGNAPRYPTTESDLPQPHSPYGVTKLAAEQLCNLYAVNYGVPAVSLRYFTVYGPRQRPDMATHRLIESALRQEPFPLYGDGTAVRDFTFVDDVVDANLAAAVTDVPPGTVCNIAGGASCTLTSLIEVVGELVGAAVPVDRLPMKAGDVARTGGTVELATELLGWQPRTPLHDGVAAQVAWHRSRSRLTA